MSGAGRPSGGGVEPRFAVSAGPLYGIVLAAAMVSAVGASWATDRWAGDASAGALGAAVAGATGLLGVVILRPGKAREASMWMTMWLAATVLRLLLTPLVAGSLYFALPLPGRAFLLSVAGAYLVCLLAETLWLARSVHDALTRAAMSGGTSTSAGDRSPEST